MSNPTVRSVARSATAIAAILLVLAIAGVCLWRNRSKPDEISLDFPSTAPGVAYVGDADCRVCHGEIADQYERSEMARSWTMTSSQHIALASDDTVTDPKLKLHYRAFERGGRLLQEEFRPGPQDSKVHSLVRLANYVVGSGNHGYSFISETNGYLNLLPLGWYRDGSKWDLSPGYERHNARFDREVPFECVSCHNDVPDHFAGSRNRFTSPLPDGISCERCHGPGELHIKIQRGEIAALSESEFDRSIINPARLPNDRRDDVCLQCHLISDVAVLAPGKEWNSYRPGQRLEEIRRDLFIKPEDPAEFGFSSHATRLRLSRCWTEGTRGSLHCINCHDAHQPLGEVPRSQYLKACFECHTPQDCTRPHHEQDTASDCVDCHMARGRPSNVAHTVFTDHWIRSRPKPRVASGMAATSEIALFRPIQLIDFWDGGDPKSATVRAIGLAKYFDVRRAVDRQQALSALDLAIEDDEENAELLFWRAATLASMRKWKLAREAYRQASEKRSDPLTLNGLGEAQREMGQLNDALATLNACAEQYPYMLATYREIAETYVASGNLQSAMTALDRSLELFPYQAEIMVRRAHLGFLGGETIGRVRDRVDEAMNLEPDSASLYWLLGQCYVSEGAKEQAIGAFEKALEIDSRHVPALLSLGPELAQAGRWDEAQQRLNQLRSVAPNHPMLPAAQQQLDRVRPRTKPSRP